MSLNMKDKKYQVLAKGHFDNDEQALAKYAYLINALENYFNWPERSHKLGEFVLVRDVMVELIRPMKFRDGDWKKGGAGIRRFLVAVDKKLKQPF